MPADTCGMSSKTPTTATVSLPPQIEIFRAGRHTDDSGTVHNFSAADVSGMVASYDPALREAPLTVGHPEHNLPAYGWVKGLAVNGTGTLVMDTHQVQPQFAEMVDAKLFKKRSASFYPPNHPNNPKPGAWYLRHVAFLGAQPPAIAGLADFAEGDATDTVSFSEPLFNQEHIRMSKELQDQLAASQAQAAIADAARTKAEGEATEAKAKLAEFAESARRAQVASFTSFCEAQIKTGCLLPKEKDAAVAVMTTLADAKEVSFSEAGSTKTVSAVDWLKDLIARAKPVVSFGEHAAGPGGNLQATKEMSDAEVDRLTRQYMVANKVSSYAEALTAVTASFTTEA
ncbi:MAG: hypothetical protein Q8R67_12160 [Rhodoferax sp.]|nr:hypothetical protein [Rhodoferax sp.]MDP3652426.1 hypothetical protein [Rhodoferax sp.]